MAATATRATRALERVGIDFQPLTYQVSEDVGSGYGEAVALAIGLPEARVFKTLVAEADGQAVVAIVPVSQRLSTKALARAAGTKRCSVASPEFAERNTGYVVGGVSPFGLRKVLATFVDSSAMEHHAIAVSGGRRGLQLLVSPHDLLRATSASSADLTA